MKYYPQYQHILLMPGKGVENIECYPYYYRFVF